MSQLKPSDLVGVVIPEKDEAEIQLEKLVFGDIDSFEASLKFLEEDEGEVLEESSEEEQDAENVNDLERLKDDELFFIDDAAEGDEDESMKGEDSEGSDDEDASDSDSSATSAAWSDSDEERITVSLVEKSRVRKLRSQQDEHSVSGKEYVKRLRAQYERIYPRPRWAEQNNSDNSSDDSEAEDNSDSRIDTNPLETLLQSMSLYAGPKSKKLLPQGVLDISRLKDANQANVSRAAIQSLHFHPRHPIMLTGGYDRTLRLFHIDGKANAPISALQVPKSSIQSAEFHADGRRVFAGGRRRYMYIWDIETGVVEKMSRLYGHEEHQRSMENFKLSPNGQFIGLIGNSGYVNFLSAASGQWITAAKVDGVVADFAWCSNGSEVSIVNTAGEVWEYNVAERQFSSRWTDFSGIGVTKIAVGANDRYTAVGTNNGVVSIYDRSLGLGSSSGAASNAVATVENLVTTISSLKFSPDGQMLAVGSRAKKDAFRLVHVPSFSVFSNWPTAGTPLGKVTAVDFSPDNVMLSAGNEGGKARLWRLNHYA